MNKLKFLSNSDVYGEDGKTISARRGHEICGLCNDAQPPSRYCKECGMLICKKCVKRHKSHSVMSTHMLITVKDYKKNQSRLETYNKPVICTLHSGSPLTFYCNTCKIPICMLCAEYVHRKPQHSHVTIIKGVEYKKQELRKQVERTKRKRKFLQDATLCPDDVRTNGERHVRMTTAEIQDHTQQLVARLERIKEQLNVHADSLVMDLQRKQEDSVMDVEDWNEEVRVNLIKLERETKKASVFVEQSNDIAFLFAVNETIAALEEVENEHMQSTPPRKFHFVPRDVEVQASVGALTWTPIVGKWGGKQGNENDDGDKRETAEHSDQERERNGPRANEQEHIV
ncbi:uncharacterized protein LOC102803335 [Saccoglossus kowalevskii]|uniref:E3 ubiquitin-protein ligase TRIM71-like n=1 Tax=Saccoglossus kowalevskii TaxID=10224 RepID=A0ABM0M458_SACKO|nr:PREDICTED: E3 ubiquitin-protein ligase TRIM71-like [Saccoglossus kowalevskii]